MQMFAKNACPVQAYFELQLADARESDCHFHRGLGCYRLALKKLWSTLRRSDLSSVTGGIFRIFEYVWHSLRTSMAAMGKAIARTNDSTCQITCIAALSHHSRVPTRCCNEPCGSKCSDQLEELCEIDLNISILLWCNNKNNCSNRLQVKFKGLCTLFFRSMGHAATKFVTSVSPSSTRKDLHRSWPLRRHRWILPGRVPCRASGSHAATLLDDVKRSISKTWQYQKPNLNWVANHANVCVVRLCPFSLVSHLPRRVQSGCSPARNQKYLEAHPVLFGLFPIYNWPLQLWFGFAVGFVMLCKSLLQEMRFFKSKPAMPLHLDDPTPELSSKKLS